MRAHFNAIILNSIIIESVSLNENFRNCPQNSVMPYQIKNMTIILRPTI